MNADERLFVSVEAEAAEAAALEEALAAQRRAEQLVAELRNQLSQWLSANRWNRERPGMAEFWGPGRRGAGAPVSQADDGGGFARLHEAGVHHRPQGGGSVSANPSQPTPTRR